MVSNCACYKHKYYNNYISIVIYYRLALLYRIEYKILNIHPKCPPVVLKSSATKFL